MVQLTNETWLKVVSGQELHGLVKCICKEYIFVAIASCEFNYIKPNLTSVCLDIIVSFQFWENGQFHSLNIMINSSKYRKSSSN